MQKCENETTSIGTFLLPFHPHVSLVGKYQDRAGNNNRDNFDNVNV